MAIHKKQKVVLRQKVKFARWRKFKSFCLKCVKFSFSILLLASASAALYRFLFISDFFLIKWGEIHPAKSTAGGAGMEKQLFQKVSPEKKKIVEALKKEISALNGQSIWKVNLTKIEKKLLQNFPQLKSCRLSRSLPNKIKVQFDLRTPLAWIRDEKNDILQGMDEERILFQVEDTQARALPQFVCSSSATLSDGLMFLKIWSRASPDFGQGKPIPQALDFTAALEKLIVTETGEITLILNASPAADASAASPNEAGRKTEIFWGSFESGTFAEKFARLADVWADLNARGLSASQINLKGVPERKLSVLDDSEIVGRVFVRLN